MFGTDSFIDMAFLFVLKVAQHITAENIDVTGLGYFVPHDDCIPYLQRGFDETSESNQERVMVSTELNCVDAHAVSPRRQRNKLLVEQSMGILRLSDGSAIGI
jgi:hypothetical protein